MNLEKFAAVAKEVAVKLPIVPNGLNVFWREEMHARFGYSVNLIGDYTYGFAAVAAAYWVRRFAEDKGFTPEVSSLMGVVVGSGIFVSVLGMELTGVLNTPDVNDLPALVGGVVGGLLLFGSELKSRRMARQVET